MAEDGSGNRCTNARVRISLYQRSVVSKNQWSLLYRNCSRWITGNALKGLPTTALCLHCPLVLEYRVFQPVRQLQIHVELLSDSLCNNTKRVAQNFLDSMSTTHTPEALSPQQLSMAPFQFSGQPLDYDLVANIACLLDHASIPNVLWGTYLLNVYGVPTIIDVSNNRSLRTACVFYLICRIGCCIRFT